MHSGFMEIKVDGFPQPRRMCHEFLAAVVDVVSEKLLGINQSRS